MSRTSALAQRWRRLAGVSLVGKLVERRLIVAKRERIRARRPMKPPHELRRARPAPGPAIREMQAELETLTDAGGVHAAAWERDPFSELLYWIPFLRWLQESRLADPGCLSVEPRGPSSWYAGLPGASSLEPHRPVLHPRLLERVIRLYRADELPIQELTDRLSYRRLEAPRLPTGVLTATQGIAASHWARVAGATALDDWPAATENVARAAAHRGGLDPWTMVALIHGVPTYVIAGSGTLGSPDGALVYRAARALGTPFVMSDASHVDLVRRLGTG